jgi:hypothetical protein
MSICPQSRFVFKSVSEIGMRPGGLFQMHRRISDIQLWLCQPAHQTKKQNQDRYGNYPKKKCLNRRVAWLFRVQNVRREPRDFFPVRAGPKLYEWQLRCKLESVQLELSLFYRLSRCVTADFQPGLCCNSLRLGFMVANFYHS